MTTAPRALPPSTSSAAPAPSRFHGEALRLAGDKRVRIGAAAAAAGLVVVLALRAKKAGTAATTKPVAPVDNSAGPNDPTIGEILAALNTQSAATSSLTSAAETLTGIASGLVASATAAQTAARNAAPSPAKSAATYAEAIAARSAVGTNPKVTTASLTALLRAQATGKQGHGGG